MRPRSRFVEVFLLLGAMLALAGCVTTGGGDDIHMQRADTPEARQNAARIHTELGQRYLQQGKLKTALDRLQTALRFDPDYGPAHTVLGALYARIGEMAKAEKHYRRAVELQPTDGGTNNNFGQFLCQEGKVREAMPYFKTALDDPFYQTPAVAWTNAGVCQIRAGNYQRAEAKFQQALTIKPKYADALYQMARAMYLQGDAFHASAFIQRYHALGRPDADALKLGYDIATHLGNGKMAGDYARRLRSTFPDSEQARSLNARTTP